MEYVKVVWHHDFDEDPILYLSELGDDRYEARKIQFFRNGRSEWADENHETASAGLSEIPFPPIEEISAQVDFEAEEISAAEFERAWAEARGDSPV